MGDDSEGYGLILGFDCDSEDFARGFGLGQVYAWASTGGSGQTLLPAESAEMLARIREAHPDARIDIVIDSPEWLLVTVNG